MIAFFGGTVAFAVVVVGLVAGANTPAVGVTRIAGAVSRSSRSV